MYGIEYAFTLYYGDNFVIVTQSLANLHTYSFVLCITFYKGDIMDLILHPRLTLYYTKWIVVISTLRIISILRAMTLL